MTFHDIWASLLNIAVRQLETLHLPFLDAERCNTTRVISTFDNKSYGRNHASSLLYINNSDKFAEEPDHALLGKEILSTKTCHDKGEHSSNNCKSEPKEGSRRLQAIRLRRLASLPAGPRSAGGRQTS